MATSTSQSVLSESVRASFKLGTPLVVRSPNWLGDAVMTMPALVNLKRALDNKPLIVACPDKLADLWRSCHFIDEVVSLTEPKNLWKTAQQLAARRFQTALIFPNSIRSTLEARVARIPQIIGYEGSGRQWLGVQTVPRRAIIGELRHQKHDWLNLVHACGAEIQEPEVRLTMQIELPEKFGPPPIVICPGAEYGPAKRWPIGSYVILSQQLISKYSLPVIFMGTKNDEALGRELAVRVPGSVNLCGKTTLREFIANLARARLIVGNDSGAMHVAAILGVPTVAIFGSTEPALTGPLGQSVTVLRHQVPCSPCFLRECPIDFPCMKGITPTMVLSECDKLLQKV